MRLFMHPASNTCRAILLLIADNDLPIDQQLVDITTGEHHKEPYVSLNPSRQVPILVEDDFILSESSAILKFIADKFDLPIYPKDLKKRAKVNEVMDWFNTGFYRDYGYGVVYPQLFPHHKRPSDEIQSGTIAWGIDGTRKWLQVLNDHYLGLGKKYLVGDELTIADYFGAALLTCGHPIRTDFKNYPNIVRWLRTIEALPNWAKVNKAMNDFRDAIKDQQFDTI